MLLMNSVKRQLTLQSNTSRVALTADERLYPTSSKNEIETCRELNDLSLSSAQAPMRSAKPPRKFRGGETPLSVSFGTSFTQATTQDVSQHG